MVHSKSSSVLPAHGCSCAKAHDTTNNAAHPILEILELFLMPSISQPPFQTLAAKPRMLRDLPSVGCEVARGDAHLRSERRGETGRHGCSPAVTTWIG